MIKTVAYLAPEIISTSATFIYKEIFALQNKSIDVIPISVHESKIIVQDSKVKKLSETITCLYEQSLASVLFCNTKIFLENTQNYLKTLQIVFGDITTLGISKFRSWKLLYQFFYAASLATIIRQNSCQHLHIHFAHVPTQIGMYASLLTGVPFSFTAHANDIFENGILLKEKVERAKAAITISNHNYHFLTEQEVDINKLKIVRCGIDTDNNKYTPRTTLNTPPKIGSLGRLVEKKGMDDVILALSKLHQKGTDFYLEIGGDGYLNDYLKKLAIKHNLKEKIIFKGAIPNDRVYSWLKELDIFILACKEDNNGDKDGIPVVLMEAMTVGIPVISTKISGIPELIQDEISGFLAEPNNPESLANTIEQLLHSPQLIAPITQAARNRVTEEFGMNSNVERLMSVFNS